MTMTQQLMTADELLSMPDDGFRYELVKGELRKMAPAGYRHGRIAVKLSTRLDQHVTQHKLGVVCAAETGFRLAANPDVVRAPGVAFIRQGRVEEVGDVEGYWPGAPDLAVEVVSPSDTYADVQEKVFDWLEAGTRMVIVVMPRRRSVAVYRSLSDIVVLTENESLDGGDVVPGWTMPIMDLFA
jgi:Uma2 family endonuclease